MTAATSTVTVSDIKPEYLCDFNPFLPVSAKTATSQVYLQVWKG